LEVKGFKEKRRQTDKGFLASKNAEIDVWDFAQNGAADSDGMEFSAFEHCASRLSLSPERNRSRNPKSLLRG